MVGLQATMDEVTVLSQSVARVQATMSSLMSKNDSVSYDMHVATFESMMKQLTTTNREVLANTANTQLLAKEIRGETETVKKDVLALQVEAKSHAKEAVLMATDTETVKKDVLALQVEAKSHAEEAALMATDTEAVKNAVKNTNTQVGSLAQQQNTNTNNVKKTNALVASIADGVASNKKDHTALNDTVYTLRASLDAGSGGSSGGEEDLTLKQQVKKISDSMKAYGIYTQCTVGTWSQFGSCSRKCDSGTMTRTRQVKPLPGYEGDKTACPVPKESIKCNTGPCPQDCVVGNYSTWTPCSSQCGPGTQVRTRKLVKGAVGGGSCPKLFESQTCEVNKIDAGTGQEITN